MNPNILPQIEYSIIIPAFNEEKNVTPLLARIRQVMHGLKDPYEVIVVDNGSSDETPAVLDNLIVKDSNLTVITLSRNFGYDGAIIAGLEHSHGSWVIIMDGDQQDPPEFIPKFLDKAREGFDIVYGIREKRTESFITAAMIKIFYKTINQIASFDIPKNAGNFGVLSRPVVDAINNLPERNKFIRGLRAWTGHSSVGIIYERDNRLLGESKFNWFRHLDNAINGLTSFSIIPLRALTYIGIIGILIFGLFGMFFLVTKTMEVVGHPILSFPIETGFTTMYLLLIFSISLTMFSLGIIGEYIGKILEETKNRPNFVVSHIKYGQHSNIDGKERSQ